MIRHALTAAVAVTVGAGGVHYATANQVARLEHRVAALEAHDGYQDVWIGQGQHNFAVMSQYVNGYLAHRVECIRQAFNDAIGYPTADDGSCAFADNWVNPVKP